MGILYLQAVQGCDTLEMLTVNGDIGDVNALATAIPKLKGLDVRNSFRMHDPQIFIRGLSHTTELCYLRLRGITLGDDQMQILASTLGSHPSISYFEMNNSNDFGDAAVATFLAHWHEESVLRDVDLNHNKIGPYGAQLLVMAVANHPNIRSLNLNHNDSIGYYGLKLIGQELAGKKLEKLSLNSVAVWMHYDFTCDDAVAQERQLTEASQALLEGLWGNFYLQILEVHDLHLPKHVKAELKVIIKANQHRRIYLLQRDILPCTFWCHFLAKQNEEIDLLYIFMRELPFIFASKQGGM